MRAPKIVCLKGPTDYAGLAYIEFTEDYPSRQAEFHGGKWYTSENTDYHEDLGPSLCDQPLSSMVFTDEDRVTQITALEFQLIWDEATKAERESKPPPS